MRYSLQLAYDGTNYHGWQIQDNANSVQQELESALSTLTQEKIEVVGCGRTDTGVHARHYVLHFDSQAINDERLFLHNLNNLLPKDIAVRKIQGVDEDFHARFSALSRTYHYRIHTSKNPFKSGRSTYLRGFDVSAEALTDYCAALIGEHDFTSFSKSGTQTETNDCEVSRALWVHNDEDYLFEIRANRFLRNMVRAIVGTCLEWSRDVENYPDLGEIIQLKDRKQAGSSAPAEGLYLVNIDYGNLLNKS